MGGKDERVGRIILRIEAVHRVESEFSKKKDKYYLCVNIRVNIIVFVYVENMLTEKIGDCVKLITVLLKIKGIS